MWSVYFDNIFLRPNLVNVNFVFEKLKLDFKFTFVFHVIWNNISDFCSVLNCSIHL
jgi:hypothetical protein